MFISNCQIGVARDVHSKIEISAKKWENNGCINKIDSFQYFSDSIFSILLWNWFNWNLERKNVPFEFRKLLAIGKIDNWFFAPNHRKCHATTLFDLNRFSGLFVCFDRLKYVFFFSSIQKRNNNGAKWHNAHFMFMNSTQYKIKKKTYCWSLFAVGNQNDHANRF